jgi:3-oxoacyl-[acyl-carrier protein] reductase
MAKAPVEAIVTGAGGGIGRAASVRLANDGFLPVVTDINEEALNETVRVLKELGHDAKPFVSDISDAGFHKALTARCANLRVLVNAAGIYWTKPFDTIGVDDFERQFAVNVTAMFSLSQAAAQAMRGGGSIVNISSRAALGGRNNTHYSAAKAAILGMTKSMALELAPRAITVNAVAPGVVLTDMLRRRGEPLDALAREQPLGRIGTPEEIAHAISFFADPRASFVTGQVLFVDGGRSIGGASPF